MCNLRERWWVALPSPLIPPHMRVCDTTLAVPYTYPGVSNDTKQNNAFEIRMNDAGSEVIFNLRWSHFFDWESVFCVK